jgi:hypothetical protein
MGPDSQAGLETFASRTPGDDGDYLKILKSGAAYFAGTAIEVLLPRFVQRADGLLVPESVTRGPQPSDLIRTFITYSEVVGSAPPTGFLQERLRAVHRLRFVRLCAALLGVYEKPTNERRTIDERLVELWFNERAKGLAMGLLRDHSTLVAPQTLLLLMQSALAHAVDDPEVEAPAEAFPGLILALQEDLGVDDADERENHVFTGDPHSRLFRQIVAGHHFSSSEDVATRIAHHHQRWVRLALRHSTEPGSVDLDHAFEQATGVAKADFTAVGMAIWAFCEVHNAYPIPERALESLRIPRATIDRSLSLMTRTADELRTLILNTPPAFATEWSFDVIRQFPLLRMPNDDLLVLSKDLLVERIFGWLPMFDLVEGLKTAGQKKEAKRANAWFQRLCELDALDGIGRLAGSRLYSADAIQTAFGTADRNADAAIEYADAWVVVEIGTHRLTRQTVVATTPEGLELDLKIGIDDKAAQLDATIRDLILDESRLTGHPARGRRRYVAVLVLTEGFPVNPLTTTAIQERVTKAGIFKDPRIGGLHVIDQEELDMAEAIAEEDGPSLLELLESHERSNLSRSAFKDWLIIERGRGLGPRRPRRLEEVRDEAWRPAVERLHGQR